MPDYRLAARRAARKHGIDPDVFERQINAESGFNPKAGSPAGAQGIAQFMPATAKGMGVNLHDGRASDDLDGAARLMSSYVKKYGSYENALRAYNAGPGAIRASRGYAETNAYVSKILGGKEPAKPSSPGAPASGPPERVTQTTPGVDRSAQRQALKLAYLGQRGKPGALLELASGLRDAQDTPGTTTTRTVDDGARERDAQPDSNLAKVIEEADRIDKASVPYLWGGGHSGKQQRGSKVTPLDCSGAVSRALGLDPRVSGQFTTWGRAGRAPGGKGVTVYANGSHVLMEVNGRFWGTSKSNPGGGAGWIPRSQITAGYLSRFTARHSANLT